MVNHCANPHCCKPLHYLREGRIYVFEVGGAPGLDGERSARRLEHFWLCGSCSESFSLEHSVELGIRIAPRGTRGRGMAAAFGHPTAIAS
jgi:hypothetical protein